MISIFGNVVYAANCGGAITCNCGDTLNESYTMSGNLNLTSCPGDGLIINVSNIVLDCNGYNITGSSSGSGVLIDYSDNNTIQNCTINGFNEGIYINGTNTTVYHNNIYNNTLGVNSTSAITLWYNNEGNYWGHDSCPVFMPMIDSNAFDVFDKYAYKTLNGWLTESPVDCPPVWAMPSNITPLKYSYTTYSQFNITWGDEFGVDKVNITIMNSTNASHIIVNSAFMTNDTYGPNTYNYSIVLPAGTWNWTSNANDSAGNWSKSDSWTFTISKEQPHIAVWLNGTNGSRSYNQYTMANFTAQVNISLIVNLSSNHPGWPEVSNTTTVYNTTNVSSQGIFNITAYTLGNQNYTALSKTYYFDTRGPQYNYVNETPANKSYYSPNQNYLFNITITDADFDKVILKLYNVTNISGAVVDYTVPTTNYTSINATTRMYSVNLTDLPAGTYNYSWFVNDTTNKNYTTVNLTYVVRKADGLGSLTVSPNTAVTYGTATTVTCPNHNENAGRNEFNETLKLETDVATNPDTEVLPVGTWNYYCTAPNTGNYTNVQKSIQIVVSAASSTPSSGLTTSTGISTTARPYVRLAKGELNITTLSITTSSKMITTIARYEDVAIRAMNITVINNVGNVKIMISKLSLLPSTVSYDIDGIVYHYINIERINISDSDINTVNIEFAVNKTWLTDNNVDASNITMYRWSNNQWNDLGATKINESAIEAFYNAASPGLSVFIIGTKGGTPEVAPTTAAIACIESWSCTDWSECVNQIQTRTCTDSNECGTLVNRPSISQVCGEEEVVGVRTISILSNVIIIIFAVIVCVLVFLQRVRITSFFRSLPERTKKLKKTKEEKKKLKVKKS